MEWVEVFKYLGRLILFVDDDTQAVRVNMKKARRCWARIIRGTYRELTIAIRRTGCSCRNGYWNESPIPSFIYPLVASTCSPPPPETYSPPPRAWIASPLIWGDCFWWIIIFSRWQRSPGARSRSRSWSICRKRMKTMGRAKSVHHPWLPRRCRRCCCCCRGDERRRGRG